jgi:hypothetical protein
VGSADHPNHCGRLRTKQGREAQIDLHNAPRIPHSKGWEELAVQVAQTKFFSETKPVISGISR